MSGSLLKAPAAQPKPPHPEPRTESYGPTSTIGLKAHRREPVDFEAKAFASKLDNLAVSGDDPTRALTDMGFDGIGSDRVRIAGGTYQACEVMTSSDSLVCSAHKLVSRNPKQTNSQAIEQIPDGPVIAKVPRNFKPPAGDTHIRVESARGDMSWYIVSDGSEYPYRVHVRTGSFAAMSIIDSLAYGLMIADLVAVIASFDIVAPEVDR